MTRVHRRRIGRRLIRLILFLLLQYPLQTLYQVETLLRLFGWVLLLLHRSH